MNIPSEIQAEIFPNKNFSLIDFHRDYDEDSYHLEDHEKE